MKDYFGYTNKVVVVTGASSGMGEATTNLLVELGAKVYALDWNECKVKGIEKYIKTDLSQKDSIDETFKNLPEHIDSFFGIAGVSGSKTDFITTTKIDFIANKYITEKYLVNRMEKGGSVAYMTSTGGIGWEKDDNKKIYLPVVEASSYEECVAVLENSILSHLPGTLAYPFSKLAMNYYVGYAQKLLTSKGIRVNAVLPGSTATGMKDEFEQMAGGKDKLLSHTGYANRLAESKEIAEPIVYLNSAMASYVSGELMVVDYGSVIQNVCGITQGVEINLSTILEMIKSKQ